LPLGEQELHEAPELLEDETRRILERARWENRALTRLEIQQIMAREEMTSQPWRWQDGLVPQAMRQGWWLLLDEVNLAEPQILERLNSVLETEPSLVLTEYDNSLIGPGGAPVHSSFRIFATMNPAEYAGRSVLSPAYRDRWRGYRFVPRPGEGEFLDMLRLLVHGQQPDFPLHGSSYQGPVQEPRYHQLSALPGAAGFLEALARFHVALEHAVGQAPNAMARIGGRRKERYVFTRRGLLSMLDYLSSPLAGEDGRLDQRALRRALLRYYLGRLSTADDRAMVIQLLDAHGLGPNTWNFG
jgi:AAA domain (dynein-related subfamily)